ncbi:hypothetical protein A2U01_0070172, partial [Trifolium medium]|nr:hypothetical protein [Trifolium medium]
DAEWAEEHEAPHEAPVEPPSATPLQPPPAAPLQPPLNEPNVEEESFGGGPHDLSLLSLYHKHRSISIWDAEANDVE